MLKGVDGSENNLDVGLEGPGRVMKELRTVKLTEERPRRSTILAGTSQYVRP